MCLGSSALWSFWYSCCRLRRCGDGWKSAGETKGEPRGDGEKAAQGAGEKASKPGCDCRKALAESPPREKKDDRAGRMLLTGGTVGDGGCWWRKGYRSRAGSCRAAAPSPYAPCVKARRGSRCSGSFSGSKRKCCRLKRFLRRRKLPFSNMSDELGSSVQ